MRLEEAQCEHIFPELIDRGAVDYNKFRSLVKDVEIRWHDIFPQFQGKLPHLKNFAMGQGDWYKWHCFEERYEIFPTLLNSRYCVFDCGIGPSQWVEFGLGSRKTYCGGSGWRIDFPECDEQDMRAFAELVHAVEVRSRA